MTDYSIDSNLIERYASKISNAGEYEGDSVAFDSSSTITANIRSQELFNQYLTGMQMISGASKNITNNIIDMHNMHIDNDRKIKNINLNQER